ncbi:hypothetical protein AKJ16_DCAP21741 [Drosera capensis]
MAATSSSGNGNPAGPDPAPSQPTEQARKRPDHRRKIALAATPTDGPLAGPVRPVASLGRSRHFALRFVSNYTPGGDITTMITMKNYLHGVQ